MLRSLGAALLALALLAAPAFAAPKFPALTGRVVDGANVLAPNIEADLTGRLEALETQTGRQLVVVTLPDLQGYEIEDYGYQLGRAWGIGEAKANNGVLFIVAPNDRKVRIEVGYGLEPILTDALSSVILQTAVIPRFKAGDIPGGVVAGTDAIAAQLALPADEAEARAKQAVSSRSAKGPERHIPVFLVLIVLFFLFGGFGRRGRRRGMDGVLPGIILGSILGGGGRGGGGGGWSGGGGFSGGGGGFGGGGSSGGW